MTIKKDTRAGVAIGVITRGTVPTEWMFHMMEIQKQLMPVGIFWKWIRVDRKSWAPARQEVVEIARKENFEWLFFIDDDVMINPETLKRFLENGKDITTGVYWTKSTNPVPVIFEKMGAGPMFNFPLDEFFEVDGSGLGCCLINMKVFDEFDKAGIPYFKENWVMELDNGRKLKCPIGEDHYFFHHAKKFGFEVWADGGSLCDHYNVNEDKRYPDKATVRRICEAGAIKNGEGEILEAQKKELEKRGRKAVEAPETPPKATSPERRSIVFLNLTTNPFAGDELERRGCGGSETDIINLSRIFAKDYNMDIHVFCQCPRPGVYDGVEYHNLHDDFSPVAEIAPDLLIVSRNARIFSKVNLKTECNAKKMCLWTHDMPGDPAFDGFEHSYPFIDVVMALTEYHKKAIMDCYPFVEEEKISILPNGVNLDYFEDRTIERVPGRMVYSSTPFRGLELIPDIFKRIKEQVPHANLKIFSSMKVYGDTYDDTAFDKLYKELKSIDGIDYVGTVKQDELAKELQKAELLLYPNIYPETSCITVMEAQAAGTPIVTSAYAALNETVPNDVGYKITGGPRTKEYQNKFVDAAVKLLTDKTDWKQKSEAGLTKDNNWNTVAKIWMDIFFDDKDTKQNVDNINTGTYWDDVYEKEIAKNDIRADAVLSTILVDKTGIAYKSAPYLLDVGCGTGEWTRYVKENYPTANVYGSDFSQTAIDYCKQRNGNIFYTNHPLLDGTYEKHFFDAITMNHLIEHLDKPEEIIYRAIELLKPYGRIVLTIPINDEPWKEHLKIWTVEDAETFAKQFTPDYDIQARKAGKFYKKDGREFEEAIVTLKFKGDNNGN